MTMRSSGTCERKALTRSSVQKPEVKEREEETQEEESAWSCFVQNLESSTEPLNACKEPDRDIASHHERQFESIHTQTLHIFTLIFISDIPILNTNHAPTSKHSLTILKQPSLHDKNSLLIGNSRCLEDCLVSVSKKAEVS